MPTIKNFEEANALLARYGATSRDRHYDVTLMHALMDFLGNPQDTLKVVHIAGTSGKTSTSYYVAALLQAAGQSVGLTVSPHVTEVNERVQFNLLPMPEVDFCKELNSFLALIATSDLKPSYFELIIAFAFWEFARRKVNYAVIEVGLGGLKDATNVIKRTDKVCIITDIGFDHVNALGHTLAAISTQKAGIIQDKNDVFCYHQNEEIIGTIQNRCTAKHATLHLIEPAPWSELAFLPPFQQRNFTLARNTVDFVMKRDHMTPLTTTQILEAAHVLVPARMEVFHYHDKVVILDGSHNAQKLQALAAGINQQFPNKSVATLVSFVTNSEYRLPDALKQIAHFSHHIIVTTFGGQQDSVKYSVNPKDIITTLTKLHFVATENVMEPEQALTKLLERPESILVVTGSFYLLNHIRPLMLKT